MFIKKKFTTAGTKLLLNLSKELLDIASLSVKELLNWLKIEYVR